ncbi:MAG: BatD family protein, partial [Gammaproteobacteria bacterium]|nr:BatD family protein [Gammaproteobacteria bacterium]
GRLRIAPVMAEVRIPSGSSFDPFRSGGKIRRLRSQQVFVDVEPIPSEVAGSYWLPATRLELREEWQSDLDGLVAGEPITRSLILVADGLTAAQLPELTMQQVDGIKQYPDQPGLQNSRSDKGVTGKREQKVALIPGAEGTYRVPEISLPWWNLETGKLETATIPARELSVAAATTAIAQPPAAEPAVTEAVGQAPPTNDFWLWLSLLLASGWIASGLYWWFKTQRAGIQSAPAVEHPGLREARRKLRQACNTNDGVSARHALLDWGRVLLAPRRINNLQQLGSSMGEDMTLQIERLNQSLYAGAGVAWQGDDLWLLCQRLEKIAESEGNRDVAQLSPLNPTH